MLTSPNNRNFFDNAFIWGILGAIIFIAFIVGLCGMKFFANYFFSNEIPIGEFLTKVMLPLAAALAAVCTIVQSIKRTDALTKQAQSMEDATRQAKDDNKQREEQFTKQHENISKQINIQRITLIETRYNNAIAHLCENNLISQLCAIHELHNIAFEAESYRKQICDIFCAFVRDRLQNNAIEWEKLELKKRRTVRACQAIETIFNILYKSEIYQLDNLDFSGANLQGISLVGLTIKNANFNNANMQYAQLYSAGSNDTKFENCKFNHTHLEGANMANTILKDVDFAEASLCWCNLYGCTLDNVKFYKADLTGVLLSDCNITCCDFTEADLSAAEMHQIKFHAPQKKLTFKKTKLCFASIFCDFNNLNHYIDIDHIDITGAETNKDKYYEKSRIERFIDYNYLHPEPDFPIGNTTYETDSEKKKQLYISIGNKILSTMVSNNTGEQKLQADYNNLKQLIKNLSSTSTNEDLQKKAQ